MTRAAIYARFSSSRQREESIEDQVRVCSRVAGERGWEVVATYHDDAISGTSAAGRPSFLRMVEDAQRGLFDALLVYKLDRFARNRFDSATYRAKLRRAGVEVVSATEGVPEGPEGIILDSVLEGMAEYYSANLAQNVRRGMEGNALRCGHNGVRVFGYECCPDGLYRVDETEAAGVRMAFRMAAEGSRKVDIASALNSAGYRTVRNRPWAAQSVCQLLRQEKYVGTYSWGGTRVEHGMPAIVTASEWDAAHENVASAGRKRRTRDVADYMLTGKLVDEAGNRFESESARSCTGRTYYYYRCRATGARVRKGEIEGRVAEALARLLRDVPEIEERVVDVVMDEWARSNADAVAAAEAARRRLAEIDREQENLIDLAARVGASDRIAERVSALDSERAELRETAEELERGIPRVEPDMVRYMLWRASRCEGPDAVVAGFVQSVVLYEDGGCLVTFNLYEPSGDEKSRTPREGVRELSFGSPSKAFPELLPWPGGFAIAV